MTREIKCNMGRSSFTHKPTSAETGKMVNDRELNNPVRIILEDFVRQLTEEGRTCRINACSGDRDIDFEESWFLTLDHDNGGKSKDGVFVPSSQPDTPESVRKTLEENGYKVFCQYKTWSDATSPVPRFRTLILLSDPIRRAGVYKAADSAIVNLFSPYNVDLTTTSPGQIFYGTNTGAFYLDYSAINNTAEILERLNPETVAEYEEEFRRKKEEDKLKPKGRKRRTSGKRGKWTGDTANLRVVEAIKNHAKQDVSFLKKKMAAPKKIVSDKAELREYIYHEINLSDLFDVTPGQAFRCVLPGHEDVNPSASVYQNPSGTWLYCCHAACLERNKPAGQQRKRTVLNIKQLIEVLGAFSSEYLVYRFICEIFNIEIQRSEWAREQIDNIDNILETIVKAEGEDSFNYQCPTASRTTKAALSVYRDILLIAKNAISPQRNAEGNIIFSMSVRQLAKVSGRTATKLQAHIKLLSYHELIDIVDDADVPPGMMKNALKHKGIGQDGKEYQHIQFYRVPSWVYEHLQKVELQGISWKDHKYRLKHLTYEEFYRNEPEMALKLYPQTAKKRRKKDGSFTQRRPSLKSEGRHMKISEFIINQIESYGYCTERMVIEDEYLSEAFGERITADGKTVTDKAYGKRMIESQLQRSINEICDSYQYIKVRCNKEIKEKYSIPGSGYPAVILKAEGI